MYIEQNGILKVNKYQTKCCSYDYMDNFNNMNAQKRTKGRNI